MRVGADGADSTLENAMSECDQFGLKKSEATDQVKKVCAVVAKWKEHFALAGVLAGDIESLSGQIDRPFLRDQRQGWLQV
jgi:serine/threonine-protein kinase HipA